ncbi:MAG: 3-oxoacyl-[acyl-carrier protein] reductase [Candidatus Azotimanducaceae bacterium]|jgi:3-oxoacyl-[acyl-carrier protein] reductase
MSKAIVSSKKVAIITGSSSGVGAATAKLLAAMDCNIVINYASSEGPANEVAEQCKALGAEVLVCKADVSDDAACKDLVEQVLSRFGRIDILINNAGTTKFVQHSDLDGLDKEDFFHIYGVNVVGPYQMIRAAEKAIRKSKSGSIVNVASIAGVRGVGSSIAYAASKGALLTMTQSMARVMGPEVRVNAVCPGFIQGEWLEKGIGTENYNRVRQSYEDAAPLKLTCTAETVADSIVSFAAGHSVVTGQYLILDGGHYLV